MIDDYRKKCEILIKIIIIIADFTIISINKKNFIRIDNVINESSYQDDIDFSHFDTKYKIIALYYPPNCNKPIEHFNKNRTESVINKTYDFNSSI